MIKKFILLTTTLLGLSTSAYSKDITYLRGKSHLSNVELNSISMKGTLTFENLEVKKHLQVKGKIIGTGLSCESLEVKGTVEANHVNAKNIEVKGKLKGLNFTCDNIAVKGRIDANHVHAENVEVNGKFIGKDIHISHNLDVKGKFDLTDALLHTIKIKTSDSKLTNSTVSGTIHAYANSSSSWSLFSFNGSTTKGSTIELHNTTVYGDVVFTVPGTVYLFGNSEIKGKVVGGELVKKNA